MRVRGLASSGRYAYNSYGPYGVGAYGALGYGYQCAPTSRSGATSTIAVTSATSTSTAATNEVTDRQEERRHCRRFFYVTVALDAKTAS